MGSAQGSDDGLHSGDSSTHPAHDVAMVIEGDDHCRTPTHQLKDHANGHENREIRQPWHASRALKEGDVCSLEFFEILHGRKHGNDSHCPPPLPKSGCDSRKLPFSAAAHEMVREKYYIHLIASNSKRCS